MTATLLIAAALLGQAPVVVSGDVDRIDVAYEELATGQASAAVERILGNPRIEADDPAALINLGAAYAMLGKQAKARECYRAAIASDERYDLELADGSWMDSRRAARKAAEALARRERFALR